MGARTGEGRSTKNTFFRTQKTRPLHFNGKIILLKGREVMARRWTLNRPGSRSSFSNSYENDNVDYTTSQSNISVTHRRQLNVILVTLSVRDGITERRIIYFEICPLCSTPCLPAAAVAAAISYPRPVVVVAMAKGVWADDDAWIGRRYSETLIRRCKKPRLAAREHPNAPPGLISHLNLKMAYSSSDLQQAIGMPRG